MWQRRAVAARPDDLNALTLLISTLAHLGRHEEALVEIERLKRLLAGPRRDMQADITRFYYLTLLGLGRWREAMLRQEFGRPHDLRQPFCLVSSLRWTDDAGRHRVGLGAGDIIKLVRWLPLTAQLPTPTITLYVPAQIVRLIRACERPTNVIVEPQPGDASPPTPWLMTLPSLLTWEALPPPARFRVQPIERPASGRLRVGLRWHTGSFVGGDGARIRDVPFPMLRPLFDVQGVEWVALHPDPPPVIANELRARGVELLAPGGDWLDTARTMASCDLVITPDTGVGHLGSSLRVETFLLLDYYAAAIWGRTDRTPLYPAMKIFRAPAPGRWGPVVADIRARLEVRVRERA